MLLQYSTDLTEKAMLGKLDPMIGRESVDGTSDAESFAEGQRIIHV